MKIMKRTLVLIMAVVIAMTAVPTTAEASTKNAALNKKSVTLKMTDKKWNPTVSLKVKNASGSIKWASSNRKVAVVDSVGKQVEVTAKKAGKATITCTFMGNWGAKKTLKCKVVVKDKRTPVDKSASKNLKVTYVKATNGDETNHLKVTYNGKDVTNKVTYKTTLSGMETTGYANVTKKGVVTMGHWYPDNGRFDVTVNYKVNNKMARKTIKLKYKGRKEVWCMECYCGWKVYGDTFAEVDAMLDEHNKLWETTPWYVYDPKSANCTGWRYKNEFFDEIVQVK